MTESFTVKSTPWAADYVIDIDGTFCTAKRKTGWDSPDYANAEPDRDFIHAMQHLHDLGYTIILFTARGQLSRGGDMHRIENEVRPILEDWLQRHDVPYDHLVMGKPWARYAYIDDKNMIPAEFKEQFLQFLQVPEIHNAE